MPEGQPGVFLDRDGVVNKRKLTLVRHPGKLELHEGVPEAIARLTEAGYLVAIVTNQSGVGYGLIDEDDLVAVHEAIEEAVMDAGGRIAGVYACPHKKSEGCDCAKPKPGMLMDAAWEHGIDPEASWMVGDKPSDIKAGRAAGARTIQVTGDRFPWDHLRRDPDADFKEASLVDAVDRILVEDGHTTETQAPQA